MFTISLGFTSDPEKAPVILAGPEVPYQKQEDDMNAAAVADTAPTSKGGPITRVEIWRGNGPSRVFRFQDPAVKDMLAKHQAEAQARAVEVAESARLAHIANLETEIARLKSPEATDEAATKPSKPKGK